MAEQRSNQFDLERNVIHNYALIQAHLYHFIKSTQYSLGEYAKEVNMDRGTFSKKFKEASWKPKELYELVNLLEKKLFPNLPDMLNQEIGKEDKKKKEAKRV